MAGFGSLEAENKDVGTSAPPGSGVPTFRMTGLALQVDMAYANVDFEKDVPLFERVRKNVDVEFSIAKKTAKHGWASVGPQTFYPVYPSGENQTYHRVTRYPQDVILHASNICMCMSMCMRTCTCIMDILSPRTLHLRLRR